MPSKGSGLKVPPKGNHVVWQSNGESAILLGFCARGSDWTALLLSHVAESFIQPLSGVEQGFKSCSPIFTWFSQNIACLYQTLLGFKCASKSTLFFFFF